MMCPMMSNYTSWGCELLRLQHGQKALRITGFLWSLCGRQHGATQQFGALRYTCHIYIYVYIYIYIMCTVPYLKSQHQKVYGLVYIFLPHQAMTN